MSEKRTDTLCWSCRKACGRCSWSAYKVWQLVAGWKAIETSIIGTKKGERVPTYIVLECPEYEPDEKTNKEEVTLSRMKWTPELKHDVLRMKEEGLSVPQIAERIGVTPVSIYSMLKDLKKSANKAAQPKEQKKAPEPKKESERDKMLDVLVFRAFDRAALRAIENDLPIEDHWRDVIAMIEKMLEGTVNTIRLHPDTEEYYLQIAATIATDTIPQKEMAPPDGDPSETI